MAELTKKESILQAVKFALFSASAGIIQVASFTLMKEVILPNLHIENEKLMDVLSAEFGVCYFIALVLSVVWNFTVNRKFTFKSATNIPIAMLKVFGFYCVFTPISLILGNAVTSKIGGDIIDYVVLAVTMLTNMITEFLFCKYVVYRGSINTNDLAKKEKEIIDAAK